MDENTEYEDEFNEAPVDLLKELEAKAAAHDRVVEGQARRNRRRNARGTFELLKKFFANSRYAESVPNDYWAWIEEGPSVSLSKYAGSIDAEYSHLVSSNLERLNVMSRALKFRDRGWKFPVFETYICDECGFESEHRELFRLVDVSPLEEYVHKDDLRIDLPNVSLCCLNCQAKHVLRLEVETTTVEGEGEFIDD